MPRRATKFKRCFTITPEVVRAKQWFPHRWVAEYGFPVIRTVTDDGPVHGVITLEAGDIVVNKGEWVTSSMAGPAYGVYPVDTFKEQYEPTQQYRFD